MKPVIIIAIVAVAMIGMMVPSVSAEDVISVTNVRIGDTSYPWYETITPTVGEQIAIALDIKNLSS